MPKDKARKETEKILSDLEKQIQKEYSQAVKETQAKLDKYLSGFDERDKAKRLLVKNGELSKLEYNKWRSGQMFAGKRWTSMRDNLAKDLANSQMIAKSIATKHMPEVYAVNRNYVVEKVSKDLEFRITFSLYDRHTVEALIRRDSTVLPLPGKRMLKKIAEGKAVRWEKGQIQSVVTQSILQGDTIPEMGKRIARTLGERNMANSIRYARTAVTSAENKGRLDGMKELENDGVVLEKQWYATGDDRTRPSHLDIDGESVPLNEEFSNGLMYPGDPSGSADEVWNCRCSMGTIVIGFKKKDGGISKIDYEREEDKHDEEIKRERNRRKHGNDVSHRK